MLGRAMVGCVGLLGASLLLAQAPAPAPEVASPAPAMPPAAAPTTPSDGEDARFTFTKVENGYLRLDVRTGQVALCSRRQVGWACQLLPDDRLVLEGEIARLQTENGALKKELLSNGLRLPSGVSAPPPQAKIEEPKSPRSDLHRALGMIEGLWRRLVDLIADWQRDMFKKS
jgi:hypothetical protein